ncbi:hypothetical protein [Tannockella kyphosi]|uniref:hypothetical protein n=1 Tax=Tannockella kyphosi TaxID=2899121 RepID=UPI0020131101|nr:hypothetical protein [Tannockella kyphosi]
MEKKKAQFIFTLGFSAIVIFSLYLFYPIFEFHTYNEVVYEEYIISLEDDQFSIQNFEYFANEEIQQIGGGTITIYDDAWLQYENFIVTLYDEEEVIYCENIEIIDEVYEYVLNSFGYIDQEHTTLGELKVSIELEDEKSYYLDVTKVMLTEITANTKEYRLESIYIDHGFMRLGKLNFVSDISEYDTISLEYRYVFEDDYVVFYKVLETIEDYEEIVFDPVYYSSDIDGDLLEKQMSVVVILSNSNSEEEYVFSIELGDEE